MSDIKVTPLRFEDQKLADLPMPRGRMQVLRGIGSGLSRSPEGRIWAVGDRGPNLKVKAAVERYGLYLTPQDFAAGAKLMPCVRIGPALSELRVQDDHVEIVRTIPLQTEDGGLLTGVPTSGGVHCEIEPAIDAEGNLLPPDLAGADTEGIVALADGSFWVGDEYGPSLLHIAPDGTVLVRWVPAGTESAFDGAPYPVAACLPAIAAKRQINRGFEAIGISPDQTVLYLAFQSPLAHPDEDAHRRGRWVRVWKLDAIDGSLQAQFAYPLDDPSTFRRDSDAGAFGWADIKVSELTVHAEDRLLFLERGSHTTKIYAVELSEEHRISDELAELNCRPTLEELSTKGADIPLLDKRLILSTDDYPEIGPDLEGMIFLSPTTLLLVNDNDFGVEGAMTCFWRIELPEYPSGRGV